MAFTVPEIKSAIVFCLASLVFASPSQVEGAASDWLSAAKPRFPAAALKNGSEGSVKLRVVLSSDGRVKESVMLRSSGDAALDEIARKTVLTWKMKPSAIRPVDLTKGRETIVEFKQEAPIVARHPDRLGYFEKAGGVIDESELSKLWMFAPFPSYPVEARSRHEQGVARIGLTIGENGTTENIRLVQSSGHKLLDDAALRAVGLWRAHKQYVGRKVTFPIAFVMRARR
jgi:TonB family protein